MNWKTLIQSLLDRGMTEKSISDAVGNTTQPTIHRIKTGHILEPKHSLGKKLIELLEAKQAA